MVDGHDSKDNRIMSDRTMFPFIYKSCTVLLVILVREFLCSDAFSPIHSTPSIKHDVPTKLSMSQADDDDVSTMENAFDAAVMGRYACTRFQRHDQMTNTTEIPSASNSTIVRQAIQCLDLARRAPSGFNAQPYKVVLVHSPRQKEALSKACIGHNAHRVRDSDCTAVFCADREVVRTMKRYGDLVQSKSASLKGRRLLKIQALIALFSSGYPLPRFLTVPISFGVRAATAIISVLVRRIIVMPSLSSAETWSTKNTMLVAMTYMLGCSSRGIATCPMEGFHAGLLKKNLGIPRRYSIPLVVSTGRAYQRPANVDKSTVDSSDDMGMSHAAPTSRTKDATLRYPMEEMLYGDSFGNALPVAM